MTLDEVQDLVLSYGYTSVNEMTSAESHLNRLLQAEADDQLRLRVNVFVNYNDSFLDENGNNRIIKFWYPENGPILDSDRMLRIPGIKIFVDGAGVPGRGCPAMRDPYTEISTSEDWFQQACGSEYGDLYWSQDELNQVVADAQAAGYRVSFHAMGDWGIETALDAIAFAVDGRSNDLFRHQIQHSSTLESDLLERYVVEDTISSVRGYFNTCDQDTYENQEAANRYDLPGLGVHAYLETDGGWRGDPEDVTRSNTLNPMVQLYGLVTHQQLRADGTACMPDP
jgi:predicted amidohydrolase YtcJ